MTFMREMNIERPIVSRNRDIDAILSRSGQADPIGLKVTEEFRKLFKKEMRLCVRKGFAVEECFGFVWEETADATRLTELQTSRLYPELLDWVQAGMR